MASLQSSVSTLQSNVRAVQRTTVTASIRTNEVKTQIQYNYHSYKSRILIEDHKIALETLFFTIFDIDIEMKNRKWIEGEDISHFYFEYICFQ